MHAATSIPVTVIGGYLGAGKTTLVNNLLRQAQGRRLAVLVNEFGQLPIDADLIEARDEDMIAITGGCICCSYGSDLVTALARLAQRQPRLDQIIVETSGVALPGAVASALTLVAGLAPDAVFVLADAETVRERAEDRFTSDTILRQLADADVVLLNKIDLLSPSALDETLQWLHTTAPQARIVTAEQARIPSALAFVHDMAHAPDAAPHHHQHPDVAGHHSITVSIDHPLNIEALAAALVQDDLGIVRAKGFLPASDGRLHALQIVGRRWSVTPASGSVRGAGRLVLITVGQAIDAARVEAAISRAQSLPGAGSG